MDIECNFYGSYLRWPLGYKLINNWVWTLSSGFVSDIKITILHSCHLWYSNDHYIGAVYQSNNMARLNTLRPNSIWEEWEVNITEIVLGRGRKVQWWCSSPPRRDSSEAECFRSQLCQIYYWRGLVSGAGLREKCEFISLGCQTQSS